MLDLTMASPVSSLLAVVPLGLVVAVLQFGCARRQLDGPGDVNEEGSGTGLENLCQDAGNARGVVDEAALAAGVVVTLTDGDTRGEVTVPFTEPLPDVSRIALGLVMVRSISLLVSNNDTGSSADIGGGNLVTSALMNPGDFGFEVGAGGCDVTLRFVNETNRGQSLVPGCEYSVAYSVSPNDYVESVPATALQATVVSN